MKIESQRRILLKMIAAGMGACILPRQNLIAANLKRVAGDDPWTYVETLRDLIVKPAFPDRDFLLTRFGGVGDGKADNTQAFAAAIKACVASGGGRVVVPSGVFKTGPIHLQSNVNLHVKSGATISFLTDAARYLPAVFTRWEGVELMGYSPLIYAYGMQNVAVTGEGVLDGCADRDTWWPWKGNKEWGRKGSPSQQDGRSKLFADAEKGVPPTERIYAEGAYLRPPFIQMYRCKNVLIEGVTIVNSPFWLIHPVLSEHVTISGVNAKSTGPNSDGCDPESCKNVLIKDCVFDTGDDCIVIKSGRNADGRRIATASERILIEDCEMRAGHGGVVIGSEISGGARNIFVQNCRMSSPDLERGIRIKTNSVRGGIIENFYLRNIEIGDVRDAIVINFYYEEGDSGKFDPLVRGVQISDLVCRNAKRAFNIRGFERAPIEQLSLQNIRIEHADDIGVIENLRNFILKNVTVNGKPVSAENFPKVVNSKNAVKG